MGPSTGAITNELIERVVYQKRLVLVEYNPGFCALLRDRYPQATVVQGDAYALRDSLWNVLSAPASAVVSGLPLVTKPMLTRLRLIRDAFLALAPGAPFVHFTYSVVPPIPKSLPGVSTEASERIWMNLPPDRVWVYRGRAFAIAAASESRLGGRWSLGALRLILTACHAIVIPNQLALSFASEAYDDMDRLKHPTDIEALNALVRQLIDVSQRLM